MRKSSVALMVSLIALTVSIIELVVNWYQLYAVGIPHVHILRMLIIIAFILTPIPFILTLLSRRR